ncbi:MAG: hypothetical protein U9Q69_01310 [Nanoarchaeota archaeon]|nr:hypothetical protein [Nanoarchaeota archaeon]
MKRGQVTLFIILGIVIVAVIGLGVFFKGSLEKKTVLEQYAEKAVVAPEVQEIYDHIYDCIYLVAKDGMAMVGMQGGYLAPPEGAIEIEEDNIAIALGYDEGKDVMPSLETIASEMALYVEGNAPACVDLGRFADFEFEETFPEADVNIIDGLVRFEVDYPIVATKAGNTYKLDSPYKFSYPLRLKKIHEISKKIIAKEIEDPTTIDTGLLDLGISIDVLSQDNKNIVYLITDQESSIDDLPYIFLFGNRFEK